VTQPAILLYQGQEYVRVASLPGPHDLYLTPHGSGLEVYVPDATHPDGIMIGYTQPVPHPRHIKLPELWSFKPDGKPAWWGPLTRLETRDPTTDPRDFLQELKKMHAVADAITGVWLWPENQPPRKLL